MTDAGRLVLIDDGKTRFAIVTPRQPDPAEAFAARELQRYLFEMTGARLETVGEGDWRGGPCVSVGATEMAARAGHIPERRFPQDDAFVIHVEGQTIVLAGCGPRGTVFAVYDFLERLGCRWFAPGFRFCKRMHEYVPRTPRLALDASQHIAEQPDFQYRNEYPEHSFICEPDDVVALLDWCAKNKINQMGVRQNELTELWYRILAPECEKRGLMLLSQGHGYERFLPRDVYYPAHPEWFGPIDGRYSDRYFDQFRISDPEALRTFLGNVREFAQAFPKVFSLSAMPNDSPKWADADRDKNPVDLLFRMNESIVKTVHEANPRMNVSMGAGIEYFGASGEQFFETSYPRVIYHTSVLRRTLKYAWCDPRSDVNRPQYEKATTALRKLRAAGRDVTWSSRYHSFRDISLPGIIYPQQMAEELRDLKRLGGSGVSFNYAIPQAWVAQEAKHYLYARMLWNTSRSPEEVLDRYYDDRFPGSPTEMKAFYDSLRLAMERYDFPGGGYTRETMRLLYPREEFEAGLRDMAEAERCLGAAMAANRSDAEKQLIYLLRGSLEWAKGKLEMDHLAETGRREEAARKAVELMDFIESWDGKGVFYDCVFLRKALEFRFVSPPPDRPFKKRPVENDRLYEFKNFEAGERRGGMAPD
ncbi:MAG: DUF4838 domain-containing protein [Candidatus Sumerlaeota bacterium]|nr:DUF4838 domain-containing protein [Candidatus Sumerlaeota bacterium]